MISVLFCLHSLTAARSQVTSLPDFPFSQSANLVLFLNLLPGTWVTETGGWISVSLRSQTNQGYIDPVSKKKKKKIVLQSILDFTFCFYCTPFLFCFCFLLLFWFWWGVWVPVFPLSLSTEVILWGRCLHSKSKWIQNLPFFPLEAEQAVFFLQFHVTFLSEAWLDGH